MMEICYIGDKEYVSAQTSDWRGLVGIQREAQDLMRFMISGGGGFLIWEESACMLVLT